MNASHDDGVAGQDDAKPRRPGDRIAVAELPDQAIACAADMGHAVEPTSRSLLELRGRLAARRFHLAVLGQFKRGKSTLLNALLGMQVMPMGVVRVTEIRGAGPPLAGSGALRTGDPAVRLAAN